MKKRQEHSGAKAQGTRKAEGNSFAQETFFHARRGRVGPSCRLSEASYSRGACSTEAHLSFQRSRRKHRAARQHGRSHRQQHAPAQEAGCRTRLRRQGATRGARSKKKICLPYALQMPYPPTPSRVPRACPPMFRPAPCDGEVWRVEQLNRRRAL